MYVDPPAVPSTRRNGTGAHHRLTVGRLGPVGLDLLLGDVLPDVLGQDRQRQQRQHGVGSAELEHHGRVVGSRHRLHRRQVGAPVARLGSAVDDPVVGVGDVARGQRLPVRPGHALADLEGPGEPVLGRLPRLRQRRHRRHVLHGVADQGVVGQRPHLVRRRLVAVERVERVHLVEQGHGEGDRLVLLGRDGRRCRQAQPGRHQCGDRHCRAGPCGATVPSVTTPPQAPREPHDHRAHGVVRADPYHWMSRVDDPALLTHLEAERLWYDAATGHLNSLVETLRSEMLGRVPATDRTVSWHLQGFSYYTALPAGREYHQLFRDFNDAETSQLLLDVNDLADSSGFVELGLCLGQPGPEASCLLGRPHRRRGLRARGSATSRAAPTSPTWCPAATTAAPGAPRRTTSSTPCTTTPTDRSRCGVTPSARRWPTTSWCSRSPTSASS